jgi:hypothetical protein
VTDPTDLPPPPSELLLYAGDDGVTRIQARLADGTVWLSQRLMAELYGKDVRTINEHLGAIYEEGELDPGATIRKYRIVQTEGNRTVSRLASPASRVRRFRDLRQHRPQQ